MPTFKYKTTVKGKVQKGEIEAENEKAALGGIPTEEKSIKLTTRMD